MIRFRENKEVWLAALLTPLLGALLQLLDAEGDFWRGWLAYSLLAALGGAGLAFLYRRLGLTSQAGRASLAAFCVRLAAGVALILLLPVAGYQDNQASQEGYVFLDAFIRDSQAWDLASSGMPLWSAFGGTFSGDQYGGMLAFSALLYRYLSPDAHRPILVLLVSALASAFGVLFLYHAAREWIGEAVAAPAAWVFALYPESILLGGSQMREAFVIPLIAVAFYALVHMKQGWRSWLPWLVISSAVLLVIHPPAALAAFVVLFILRLLDPESRLTWKQLITFSAVLLAGLLFVVEVWSNLPSLEGNDPLRIILNWLQNNFYIQSFRLERASGWMQKLLETVGEGWWPVIVITYGVAQPVLPAALFDPAAWIWVVINVARAAGWYLLAPFLVYGLLAAWRASSERRRWQLAWLGLAILAWVLVASANAGGNLWDNPRYRTIFLAFQALLSGWAWVWARQHKDAWLGRLMVIEGVFVLFFSQWYASRNYGFLGRLNFWVMVASIVAIGFLVVILGWLRDRRRLARVKHTE